jgi:DNA-binding transcriptional MerR regulator/methylmalonyl-CoA mutase cobalamin-binding subunit
MRDKQYSVQAVARLTGLTPDTLRAWERRYGAVVPEREGKGRRAYTEGDVQRLLLLKQVCDQGHAIRLVAPLANAQLREMVVLGQDTVESFTVSKDVVGRLLRTVDRFSMGDFEQELGRATVSLDMRRLILEVVQPLLAAMGDRWERGDLSVAQEHVVSATLRTFLGGLLRHYPRRGGPHAVVLTTVSGELHEFGILMLYVWAASEGYGCHYLGPSLPAEEIVRALRATDAKILGISVVRTDNLADVAAQIRDVSDRLKAGEVEIWIGGPGAAGVLPLVEDLPVLHVEDLAEFEHRLQLQRAR